MFNKKLEVPCFIVKKNCSTNWTKCDSINIWNRHTIKYQPHKSGWHEIESERLRLFTLKADTMRVPVPVPELQVFKTCVHVRLELSEALMTNQKAESNIAFIRVAFLFWRSLTFCVVNQGLIIVICVLHSLTMFHPKHPHQDVFLRLNYSGMSLLLRSVACLLIKALLKTQIACSVGRSKKSVIWKVEMNLILT